MDYNHPAWRKEEAVKKNFRALESALVAQPPVTSGTIAIPQEQCVLYYDAKDGVSRKIDLSKATPSDLDALQDTCLLADSGSSKVGVLGVGSFFPKLQFPQLHSTLERVRKVLAEGEGDNGKALVAELCELSTYGVGALVKPHKATSANDAFATLVVILPTAHSGGDLVIRHAADSWVFGLSGTNPQPSPNGDLTIGYVAFFNDVEQEVLPVTSGCRVTLTYTLRWVPFSPNTTSSAEQGGDPSPLANPDSLNPKLQRLTETLTAILANPSVLPEGGSLGFHLQHLYPISTDPNTCSTILSQLKGSDRTLYRACTKLLPGDGQVALWLHGDLEGLYALCDRQVIIQREERYRPPYYVEEEDDISQKLRAADAVIESTDDGVDHPVLYEMEGMRKVKGGVAWVNAVVEGTRVVESYELAIQKGVMCEAKWNPCFVLTVGKPGERGACDPKAFAVISEDDEEW